MPQMLLVVLRFPNVQPVLGSAQLTPHTVNKRTVKLKLNVVINEFVKQIVYSNRETVKLLSEGLTYEPPATRQHN